MSRFLSSLVIVASVMLLAQDALAKAYLSCQKELKLSDCTAVGTGWNVTKKLHVAISCQVCTSSGSNIKCTPGEKITSASLTVQTPAGKAIAGSFTKVGSCDLSVPLFRFSGTLQAGNKYWIVANVSGFDKVLLLEFTTTGGSLNRDSGVSPKADKGGAISKGDGGNSGGGGEEPGGSIPLTESGVRIGDGGHDPANNGMPDDDGCSCQLHGPASAAPAIWMLISVSVLGCLRRRKRRTPR